MGDKGEFPYGKRTLLDHRRAGNGGSSALGSASAMPLAPLWDGSSGMSGEVPFSCLPSARALARIDQIDKAVAERWRSKRWKVELEPTSS